MIEIKQAQSDDIAIIEEILLDAVNWMSEIKQPLWGINEVTWEVLSKSYQISDFYIAYLNGNPCGCMIMIDHDPRFWPGIKKGESLFIHKLAVKKVAKKQGVSDALIDFFKKSGAARKMTAIRLDTHQFRPKLRAFYEQHGFVCVEEKCIADNWFSAFYEYRYQTQE